MKKVVIYLMFLLLSTDTTYAQKYFPDIYLQQRAEENILLNRILSTQPYVKGCLDSNYFIRRFNGLDIPYITLIGCELPPLDITIYNKIPYPQKGYQLYSIRYPVFEQNCRDMNKKIDLKYPSYFASDFLVGYDSSKKEVIFISGDFYCNKIAQDFHFNINQPKSDSLVNFVLLKTYRWRIEKLIYDSTVNGWHYYKGYYNLPFSKGVLCERFIVKVKINNPDIVIVEENLKNKECWEGK
ncbi:MAG: hypothetical protein K1X81_10075 [Bacteroidia bacterium]|nr:hypothetical protein [Bacteroidia bacterium]